MGVDVRIRAAEKIADAIRNANDEVFIARDAITFLRVGEQLFSKRFSVCGFRAGRAVLYRKSDLLARLEQLRLEGALDDESADGD